MTNSSASDRNKALRRLPSVGALLSTATARVILEDAGELRVVDMARTVVEGLREDLESGRIEFRDQFDRRDTLLAMAEEKLRSVFQFDSARALRRVINASGVILHTNLGRAPLSSAAIDAITKAGAGYCTLEYDTVNGSRGGRGEYVEHLLAELTGAESALVVNNCAAASLLVLSALARGGETIVSRGELVEIGGDFRVPDVMAQSGTHLVEVGTTNRTRLSDYERAITDSTQVIMRVHPSNYRIVGFTATPTLSELAELSHQSGLILYEDAGSGAIFDLAKFGIDGEPIIGNSIKAGADLVTFSGDKLFGGPQAGLIVGIRNFVERLRKHPLYRAVRPDKLTLAGLHGTLSAYLRGTHEQEIPVIRMLALSKEELEARSRTFVANLNSRVPEGRLSIELIDGKSAVGGGSAPTTHPATSLIALVHSFISVDALDSALRSSSPPVIARIADGRVLLDLRTVADEEESDLLDLLIKLAGIN